MQDKVDQALQMLKKLDGPETYEVLSNIPVKNLLHMKQMIEHIYYKDLIEQALKEYKDEESLDFDDEDFYGEC